MYNQYITYTYNLEVMVTKKTLCKHEVTKLFLNRCPCLVYAKQGVIDIRHLMRMTFSMIFSFIDESVRYTKTVF